MTLDPSNIEIRYLDKALETRLSLWSALLTLNGVAVGAFSILAIVVKDLDRVLSVLVAACLIAALVSLILLLMNFEAAKAMYERIGQTVTGMRGSLTNQEKADDIQQALRKHRGFAGREKITKGLFIAQVVLLIAIFGWQEFRKPNKWFETDARPTRAAQPPR